MRQVGYCYTRYSAMFGDLETCMRSIIQCCTVARVSFRDSAALYDLWRFLNLLHVTAYCGVSATYTRANLCDEFCAQHGLLIDPNVRERLEDTPTNEFLLCVAIPLMSSSYVLPSH